MGPKMGSKIVPEPENLSKFQQDADYLKTRVLLQENRGFEGSRCPKIDANSIKILCKINTRKMYAKIMENDAKREPKWEPKSTPNR